MIEMTEEEFGIVYEALEMANNPYTEDDVPTLVAQEFQAWKVVKDVRSRAALDG